MKSDLQILSDPPLSPVQGGLVQSRLAGDGGLYPRNRTDNLQDNLGEYQVFLES